MDMLEKVRADARTALFDAMTEVRAGMLGVEGSGQHMQPMTHFLDEDTAELWFITASDTDLVRAVGQGARAHYCVISKDQTLHACLSGTIVQSQDTDKLDALWSPVATHQSTVEFPAETAALQSSTRRAPGSFHPAARPSAPGVVGQILG